MSRTLLVQFIALCQSAVIAAVGLYLYHTSNGIILQYEEYLLSGSMREQTAGFGPSLAVCMLILPSIFAAGFVGGAILWWLGQQRKIVSGSR